MIKHICPIKAKEYFSYDKQTGELKKVKGKTRNGKTGYIHTCGSKASKKQYIKVGFQERYFYAHRIIWVLVTGEQPKGIDHIDGNGLNNKWANLRSVTQNINGKNQKKHVTNTSGVGGITYRKDSDRWRARIMVNGKSISLGTFINKDDAIAVRLKAEQTHGFIV